MLKRSLPFYFIMISMITAVLVLSSGLIISWIDHSFLSKPFYQMKQLASSKLYLQMMDDVIPGNLVRTKENNSLPLMLKTILGVDLTDPGSLLMSEIPFLNGKLTDNKLISKGIEHNQLQQSENTTKIASFLSDEAPVFAHSMSTPSIFIYHTHSRESWLPEVKNEKQNKYPFHVSKNITLVGKRFAEHLEKVGIPVHYNNTDHDDLLVQKEITRALAYAISADTVVEAMSKNPEIEYIFDFHRDAVKREYTTTTIDGIQYAKVMFVIGKQNKNWKENLAFAEQIQKILDEKYPGLCRPIAGYEQDKSHNGEYNQSYSSHALTVEIGGIENTLEESMRTVEILADAFAEIYLEAVPVMAKKESVGK